MIMIDLTKEMAWITFFNDGWGKKWFPILDPITGQQLEFDDTIMDRCRAQYNGANGGVWTYFGIAPTSQMMMGNDVRNNL
jgi:hypothetical protein